MILDAKGNGSKMSIIGSLISGVFGGIGSLLGSQKQDKAAQAAVDFQRDALGLAIKMLGPYRSRGNAAGALLLHRILPQATRDIRFNTQAMRKLPGYAFTREEGLRGIQNQMSAMGLGRSGPVLKESRKYAENLADTYWKDYFNAEMAQRANRINPYMQFYGIGENAAAQSGNAAVTTGQGIADSRPHTRCV